MTCEGSAVAVGSAMLLMQVFVSISDPRSSRQVRYDLSELITVAVCSVLCGADEFSDIEA